jgi:hypothetical protein
MRLPGRATGRREPVLVALDTVVVTQQVGVHMKLRSSNCDLVPIAFGQPVHLDHVAAFHARRMVGPGWLFTAPGQHPAWEGSPAPYDWGAGRTSDDAPRSERDSIRSFPRGPPYH